MELGSYFLFLQEQIKDIIILHSVGPGYFCGFSGRTVHIPEPEHGAPSPKACYSPSKHQASHCLSPDDDVFYLFLQQQKIALRHIPLWVLSIKE
jgi:hypothetical protein